MLFWEGDFKGVLLIKKKNVKGYIILYTQRSPPPDGFLNPTPIPIELSITLTLTHSYYVTDVAASPLTSIEYQLAHQCK